MEPGNKETYISSRQAADMLGLSLRTIQLWVENGILKAWKTAGGHRRITKSSVDALLKEREEAIRSQSSGASFTLVIVEDEEAMLDLYKMHIKRWDLPVTVITAKNGFEGLLKIGQHLPQLIFTDLDMPGMDGFSMLEALHDEASLKNSNIAVITGLGLEQIEAHGHLPSNVAIYSKPVNFDELHKFVSDNIAAHLGKPAANDA